MLKKVKHKIRKNVEILSLIILILSTATFTSYFNYKKENSLKIYDEIIENIYFKKTLNHLVNNLEPKYNKIKHNIKPGETFDNILEKYYVNKEELLKIKNSLKNKVNLNKLNTNQIIKFSLDKTNNKISEFTFQISNTQKVFLKSIEEDKFEGEIVIN